MAIPIVMPRLVDFMTEGVVARFTKSQGDIVNQGEVIAEIETEKVNHDLEASVTGVFHPSVDAGATVAVDDVMGYLLNEGEEAPVKESSEASTTKRTRRERSPSDFRNQPRRKEVRPVPMEVFWIRYICPDCEWPIHPKDPNKRVNTGYIKVGEPEPNDHSYPESKDCTGVTWLGQICRGLKLRQYRPFRMGSFTSVDEPPRRSNAVPRIKGAKLLSLIDWQQFEILLASILKDAGWKTQTTGGGNDGGVDVEGSKGSQRLYLQAKHFKAGGKVGRPALHMLMGAAQIRGVTHAILATSSDFTRQAKEETTSNLNYSVELWNGKKIATMIDALSTMPYENMLKHMKLNLQ